MLSLDSLQLQSVLKDLRSPKSRQIITAVLCVLSIIIIGLMLKVLLSAPPTVATDALQVSNKAPTLRWNWFPAVRQPVEQPKQEETTEELARATIKAELLGAVLAGDQSYAVISTSRNPQGVYSVGDKIENNVTVEEIQDYRVIISQRGSRRQIPLKSLDKKAGASNSSGNTRNSLIEVNDSPAQSGSGFNLSGLVSTTPIQLPDGNIGLKLGGLSEDLTDLADVQEGDVVLAVNGTAVSDMLTNPLLWQQFSQQTNMPITIKRGENEIELFVNAASLSQKILPRIGAGLVQ